MKRTRNADFEFRYNQKGRTFMVERVEPKGKYGKAFGYCLIDGVRNDAYMKETYPDNNGEIPCAGCGEWTLVDIPGIDMDEVFPIHKVDEVLQFGKHKGKSISEIYKEDPKYIFWLADSDPYYKIDFATLTGIDPKDEHAKEKFNQEIDRIFPKTTIDDIITFGKYKGLTYKAVYEKDPQYLNWLLRNNQNIDFDMVSFGSLF